MIWERVHWERVHLICFSSGLDLFIDVAFSLYISLCVCLIHGDANICEVV